jgi:hypothetical protein
MMELLLAKMDSFKKKIEAKQQREVAGPSRCCRLSDGHCRGIGSHLIREPLGTSGLKGGAAGAVGK